MAILEQEIDKAAYNSLLITFPSMIDTLKSALKNGMTAKQLESKLKKIYGGGNRVAMSIICAAYHMEANPELLTI